jgi:hypothetical protein
VNAVAVELFFMMVVLKLPVVYLCGVVWWAVRAEPRPFEGAARLTEEAPPLCPWNGARRPRPRGGRSARAAAARRARVRA